jgi:hypothetical protein
MYDNGKVEMEVTMTGLRKAGVNGQKAESETNGDFH